MGFLDNSGDIILDAVLTDLGRKRLAEGNFRITQFALGDDEIDYALYNKDHPSGSAYYDLEILQTPVFEAFTRTNANINYGLLSYNGRADLLYLPSMLLNEKSLTNNVTLKSGISYLAVNESTRILVEKTTAAGTAATKQEDTKKYFIFETGLQTAGDPDRTESNRKSFIVANGLLDNDFTLSCDSRFITSVYPIDVGNSTFKYDNDDKDSIKVSLASIPIASTSTSEIDNYKSYNIGSIDNEVYKVTDDGNDLNVSQFNGPRARVTSFTFGVAPGLESTGTTSPAKYSLYGKTAQNLFADGSTYDYIDTIVYIHGNTTGVTAQLPVRIIRQNT